MMKIYDGRTSFYQYDLNQKLTAEDLVVGDEIHFYNRTITKALVMKAYEFEGVVVVDVPNILLREAAQISVYKYLVEEETCCTIKKHYFNVKSRPCPENYVYEETDIHRLETLLERALKEAQESGAFKGEKGDPGNDYVLTETDKNEIAMMALKLLPDGDEVRY